MWSRVIFFIGLGDVSVWYLRNNSRVILSDADLVLFFLKPNNEKSMIDQQRLLLAGALVAAYFNRSL